MKTFMDHVLAGEAKLEAIDDWVGEWHEYPDAGIPIEKWLGLTKEELNVWVQNPNALEQIVQSRRNS